MQIKERKRKEKNEFTQKHLEVSLAYRLQDIGEITSGVGNRAEEMDISDKKKKKKVLNLKLPSAKNSGNLCRMLRKDQIYE